MHLYRVFVVVIVAVLLGPGASRVRADEADDLVKQAREQADHGQMKEALETAGKVIQLNPVKGYFFRAALYDVVLRKPAEALADYDALLKKDPKLAEAYNQRGSVHFKLGHIKESLADFDRFLELKPGERNGHWRRGITCYYAGRFKEGQKQLEGYEAVDTNDVENSVWHFLCLARAEGVAKARQAILKIGKDSRVPMMQVYALYQGKIKPEEVLAAANKAPEGGKKADLKRQLFYAHLYLGLYYEVLGDKKKALEHMTKAATDYVIGHYMGDVARVHLAIMKKAMAK
jgi:lipoprotein NlpI